MPRCIAPLILLALLALATPAGAARLQTVSTSVASPTFVTGEPGSPARIFVTEQAGRIRLVENGTTTTFLDVTAKVDSGGYEEGLLSMAFAPDYATSGRFWIAYTAKIAGDAGNDLVVEERRRASADRADPDHAHEVIRIPHADRDNHNGGQIQIGPDGMLWIGTGDGGGANDPDRNAQNRDRLAGKLLRVDPKEGEDGYTIPPDNPFVAAGGRPEIWAYGLRNPWRFSFDRLTGDLTIGDVGQSAEEEIDLAPAASGRGRGANYGWVVREGNRLTGFPGSLGDDYLAPVLTHAHRDGWRSIVGGYVLRDPSLPGLEGCYVYTDTYKGELRSADLATGSTRPLGLRVEFVTSFGEDAAGRLLLASQAAGIQRLVADPGSTTDPADCTPPGPTPPGSAADPIAPGTGWAPAPLPLPGADRAVPVLRLLTARRQRALRRRAVLLRGTCGEACRVTVSGRLGKLGVRGRRVRATAGQRWAVRLKLGPKALRSLRRSLARGRRPVIVVRIRAADDAGNVSARKLRIRLVR